MAIMTIMLRRDPQSGKQNIVIKLDSDADALPQARASTGSWSKVNRQRARPEEGSGRRDRRRETTAEPAAPPKTKPARSRKSAELKQMFKTRVPRLFFMQFLKPVRKCMLPISRFRHTPTGGQQADSVRSASPAVGGAGGGGWPWPEPSSSPRDMQTAPRSWAWPPQNLRFPRRRTLDVAASMPIQKTPIRRRWAYGRRYSNLPTRRNCRWSSAK